MTGGGSTDVTSSVTFIVDNTSLASVANNVLQSKMDIGSFNVSASYDYLGNTLSCSVPVNISSRTPTSYSLDCMDSWVRTWGDNYYHGSTNIMMITGWSFPFAMTFTFDVGNNVSITEGLTLTSSNSYYANINGNSLVAKYSGGSITVSGCYLEYEATNKYTFKTHSYNRTGYFDMPSASVTTQGGASYSWASYDWQWYYDRNQPVMVSATITASHNYNITIDGSSIIGQSYCYIDTDNAWGYIRVGGFEGITRQRAAQLGVTLNTDGSVYISGPANDQVARYYLYAYIYDKYSQYPRLTDPRIVEDLTYGSYWDSPKSGFTFQKRY